VEGRNSSCSWIIWSCLLPVAATYNRLKFSRSYKSSNQEEQGGGKAEQSGASIWFWRNEREEREIERERRGGFLFVALRARTVNFARRCWGSIRGWPGTETLKWPIGTQRLLHHILFLWCGNKPRMQPCLSLRPHTVTVVPSPAQPHLRSHVLQCHVLAFSIPRSHAVHGPYHFVTLFISRSQTKLSRSYIPRLALPCLSRKKDFTLSARVTFYVPSFPSWP
jgi:hypothetical protein